MPQSFTSPCKLNLFLYITGKRENGYHNLQTLFTILNYGDVLHFDVTDDGKIDLLTDFNFPKEDNLIYKAAMLLKEYTNTKKGCLISCDKVLLEGGGLGGGSSDGTCINTDESQTLNIHRKKASFKEIQKNVKTLTQR